MDTLTLPVHGGGSRPDPTPKGFSSITFEKHKLETPNFAESKFNNRHIGRCNQIWNFQNLGGGEVKIWRSVKKCQNYRCFDIFWDILDERKSNLGQECVK